MKLALDPMPALRASAEAKVNQWFDAKAQPHRDAAHTAKRAAATAGSPYPVWFSQEAALRKITPAELANLILSKPDVVGHRELQRQQTLAQIAAAATPDALTSIVDILHKS